MMRYLIIIWYSLILLACEQEIVGPDKTFIKIYGNELTSKGYKIRAIGNNQYAILGQSGKPTLNFDGPEDDPGADQEQGIYPSVIILDESGNLIKMASFPIEMLTPFQSGLQVTQNLYIANHENTGTFTDILVLSDGSFLLLGEWQVIPAIATFPSFKNIYDAHIPFKMHLDHDLNYIGHEYFDGNAGWDGDIRSHPEFFSAQNGDNYILFKSTYRLSISSDWWQAINQTFHSLMKLDASGNQVWMHHYYNRAFGYNNRAWGMSFDEQNNPIVVAKLDESIRCFKLDPSGQQLSEHFVEESNEIEANQVGVELLKHDNGYLALHNRLQGRVQLTRLNNQLQNPRTSEVISGYYANELLTKAISVEDGNFVMLVNNVDLINAGVIRKIDLSGNVLWERNLNGKPQDIIQTEDGNLLVLYNPIFNDQLIKATVMKITSDGAL